MRRLLFFVLLILATHDFTAQSIGSAGTRLDQIEAERIKKAATVTAEQPSASGKLFDRIGHFIQPIPIRAAVEGLGPGAGPAVGSIFKLKSEDERTVAQVWGVGLLHGFYRAGTGIEFQYGSRYRPAVELAGSHADSPQLEYYGPGPDSSIHNLTDFRREDTLFNLRTTFHIGSHLKPSCRLGELLENVGPGTNEQLATTQSVFGPAEAPGIDVQSDFLIGGCAAELDLRDSPDYPRKGTYALVVYDRYYAQDAGRFSFHRLTNDVEQYIPFFNGKRVIALDEKTWFNFHSFDEVVPFYLQPTLASDTDLRGFRRYRFYDENAIAATAEYRWEINSALDMALFIDAGKVFHQPGQLSLSGMGSSGGFGLRFKTGKTVGARLDTGFSREGFQVWLRAGKLF